MSTTSVQAFEAAFADYQGAVAARAFWMGRVGLYAVLRAMGIGAGDRVGICAYTCLGVVEAVARTGARPVFLDIDRQMNIAPESLERLGEPIKVLIAQHTFGVPAPIEAYLSWAGARSVPVIEDCCQAPGAKWNGRKVGSFGVGGLFSLEWSKPFTTGCGGVFTFNDASLARAVDGVIEVEGHTPGMTEALSLAIKRRAHRHLVTPRTRNVLRKLYRMVRRGGTTGVVDNTQPIPTASQGFLRLMPPLQARGALKEFREWESKARPGRIAASAILKKRLMETGIPVVEPDAAAGPAYLRMPIWVRDKNQALVRAAAERIDIGGWFATPADPICGPALDEIGYRRADCPVAEEAFASVVTLPVYPAMPDEHLETAVRILRACVEGKNELQGEGVKVRK